MTTTTVTNRTRNVVDPATAEHNRTTPGGGYTFNAFPPDDYEGRILVVAVLRLGDHAHIEVSTGRQVPGKGGHRPTLHYSRAGMLVFAWADWLHWRAALDADERILIAEVERPTDGQLEYHRVGS